MKELKARLLTLLKENAYKKGEFNLSSGKTSQHYFNCKPVILSGEGLVLAGTLLLDLVEEDSVGVGGLTLGADPLVSSVALTSWLDFDRRTKLNAFIVRKQAKGHGTGAWIEGPLPLKGSKITVLEDVTTTGGSSIKAVEKIREAGYVVERVITIIERGEGAEDAMKDAGLELCSLFTLEDFTI
tara:strand:- start:1395 stop:1946 length:552 start_codon:yes stop_codon:yes gene_type:complete